MLRFLWSLTMKISMARTVCNESEWVKVKLEKDIGKARERYI